MSAPTDPGFYTDLATYARAWGMKPEDALWIWSSETGLDPSGSGSARTISTLLHGGVVPSLLSETEWASLPSLTARQQLPFIDRYYSQIHQKYLLGRDFKDTFEVYLANAAPGLLRVDGRYNPASVMYGSPDEPGNAVWIANWPMDNYPAALRSGLPLTTDSAKLLLSEGKLKGYITLGDLRAFGLRQANSSIANDAINRLHDALLNAKADQPPLTGNFAWVPTSYQPAGSPGGYTPDFSKSFSDPNAPIDTRVAPQPSSRSLLSLPEAGALAAGVWLFWRFFLR